MDRQLRRRGHLSSFAGVFGRSRPLILGGAPLLISSGIRRAINSAGFVLDELLYRRWHDVEIRPPLFIVAPARSGTTMLFHQLAADPQFAATTLGLTQLYAISVVRLLRRMAAKERKFILAMRDGLDQSMAALDDTHVIRIGRLEEDEGFFNDTCTTLNHHLLFPQLYERFGIPELDSRPARFQAATARRYRRFIRRVLYLTGPERTYLSKNVQSAGRIAWLERTLPGIRYINIFRDPVVQLPSALALMRAVDRNAHGGRGRPVDHPYWRMMVERMIEYHQVLLDWERRIGPERWLTLRYDDLIADPAASLRRIYAHFGIPLPPERAAALDAGLVDTQAKEFRKHRSYTLADHGLEPEQIRERLAAVYEAHAPASGG